MPSIFSQQGHFDVKKGFEKSLQELDMEYIDLYVSVAIGSLQLDT
jgi:diketogulonate reductase-like aldo/keto reductase